MREAIRQRLLAHMPSLSGQAYGLEENLSAAVPPYLVIVQGPDVRGNDWLGIRRTFDIWPYAGIGSGFAAVDDLTAAIVQALDEQTLSEGTLGPSFVCRYRGTVDGDRLNEAKSAITRGVRFEVTGLPDGRGPETAADDSWLAALGNWSSAWLGSGWHVHLAAWPPDVARPSVLWRIQGMETRDSGAAGYEVRKRIVGHFVGSTPNGEMAAVYEAIGRLQAGTKIALDSVAGTRLKVADVQADMQADGLTAGQLAVTLSRRVNRSAAEAPLMRQVSIHN